MFQTSISFKIFLTLITLEILWFFWLSFCFWMEILAQQLDLSFSLLEIMTILVQSKKSTEQMMYHHQLKMIFMYQKENLKDAPSSWGGQVFFVLIFAHFYLTWTILLNHYPAPLNLVKLFPCLPHPTLKIKRLLVHPYLLFSTREIIFCFPNLISFHHYDIHSQSSWLSPERPASLCCCGSSSTGSPVTCWPSTLHGLTTIRIFIMQVFFILIFIGPESDHWLCLSLTHWLTD